MRCLLFYVAVAVAVTPVFGDGPKVIHDIVYGHKDGLAMSYDVIVPAEGIESNGAMVAFMASGAWYSRWFPAEKLLDPANPKGSFIRSLLDDGYSVAIVRHGSSPRYHVVDATGDVKKALRHLRDDIPRHGLDPERIGVYGFSAGGHLSLMLGTMGGRELPDWVKQQRNNDDQQQIDEGTSPVAAVVAWFPPTDLRPFVGPDAFPAGPAAAALDFDPDDAPDVSPLVLADHGDAPTLLLHGTKDTLVTILASTAMHQALKAADVETEFESFDGEGHGFGPVQQRRAESLAKAWFDKHLLP